MNRSLGQYMTPVAISDLVLAMLGDDKNFDSIVDFAAGDCSLLSAGNKQIPNARILGVDIDEEVLSRSELPNGELHTGDGLEFNVPSSLGRCLVLGNPPFGESADTHGVMDVFDEVFPGMKTKRHRRRLETAFLTKSLELMNKTNGKTIIILPAGFADGERYSEFRSSLISNYSVIRVIEIPSGVFDHTEAKSVALFIEAKSRETSPCEVFKFDLETGVLDLMYYGDLNPDGRLDSDYFALQDWANLPKLSDLGVTVSRGKHHRKASSELNIRAIHTSDLNKAHGSFLCIDNIYSNQSFESEPKQLTLAEPGDILLARTGKRVSWRPLLVKEGSAPITDHVFRVRAPKKLRDEVFSSFQNPQFNTWLERVSKGVCATVLTKKDLLQMPMFHFDGKVSA